MSLEDFLKSLDNDLKRMLDPSFQINTINTQNVSSDGDPRLTFESFDKNTALEKRT